MSTTSAISRELAKRMLEQEPPLTQWQPCGSKQIGATLAENVEKQVSAALAKRLHAIKNGKRKKKKKEKKKKKRIN
jgi:hypothetical protein